MQHSWLLHINFFIEGTKAVDVDGLINDDKETCSSLWEEVMKCACENKLALSSKEQRIITWEICHFIRIWAWFTWA